MFLCKLARRYLHENIQKYIDFKYCLFGAINTFLCVFKMHGLLPAANVASPKYN